MLVVVHTKQRDAAGDLSPARRPASIHIRLPHVAHVRRTHRVEASHEGDDQAINRRVTDHRLCTPTHKYPDQGGL
jgi:hypothetical protein